MRWRGAPPNTYQIFSVELPWTSGNHLKIIRDTYRPEVHLKMAEAENTLLTKFLDETYQDVFETWTGPKKHDLQETDGTNRPQMYFVRGFQQPRFS